MLQHRSLGDPGEEHCGYEHQGGHLEGPIQGAGPVFNGTAQPGHEEAETPADEHTRGQKTAKHSSSMEEKP